MGEEIKVRDLYEILNQFNEAQRDYLCLRIKGLDEDGALKGSKRKKATLDFWRMNDIKFKEEEVYLLEKRGEYKKEAGEYFSGYLFSITFGLLKLASKVVDWEELSKADKQEVFKACQLLNEMQRKGVDKKVTETSYDEEILKKHKELKGV